MTDTKTAPAESRPSDPTLVIPDDPEQSVYRFITVAAKRARQLQSGARPKIATTPRKMTRVAVEETRRGLVEWMDPERMAQQEPEEEGEPSDQ